jgi:hypothetical protein
MPLHRNRNPLPRTAIADDDNRWLLAQLESAQRRDPYVAGRGDKPRRARRGRWSKALAKIS